MLVKIVQPVFFYLDAHWYNYNPLLDELKVIAKYNMNKSVIAIHDFKVPGKDFGYDKFPDGKDYAWSNIQKYIEDIYGKNKYDVMYNEKTSGVNRGIIFIIPKDKNN